MNSIRDFPILREELNEKKTPEAIPSPCTIGMAQTRQIENIGIKQDGKQVRYTAKISNALTNSNQNPGLNKSMETNWMPK